MSHECQIISFKKNKLSLEEFLDTYGVVIVQGN